MFKHQLKKVCQPVRVERPQSVFSPSLYGPIILNNLPTLSATSTAVFTSLGLNASTIYTLFVGLIGTAVDFGLWLIQVSWPFMLGLAFIYLMWHLARKFMGIGPR